MNVAAGAAGALIALQAEQKRREIVAYFEDQEALDPSSAVILPADGRLPRSVLDEMLRFGDVRQAGEGKYWLDRDQAERRHARSKRLTNRALTIISAVAAAAAIAVLAFR
jgi:hypothetical protein